MMKSTGTLKDFGREVFSGHIGNWDSELVAKGEKVALDLRNREVEAISKVELVYFKALTS